MSKLKTPFFISYCHHRHSHPDLKAPALLMKDVHMAYSGDQRAALKNVSVSVAAGTSIALVGPNGAGKTTLFKAAANLMKIKSGRIKVFGQSRGSCHQRVVYLPQRSAIDWQFPISVMELVLTGRYVYLGWLKRLTQKDRDLAQEAMKELSIEDLADRQIGELSGGQQQRVLIARALVQDADLLLLDEPLNAVDLQTRKIVQKVLSHLKSQGKTTIVATHYFNEEEGIYDGAIYLKDGEVCTSS